MIFEEITQNTHKKGSNYPILIIFFNPIYSDPENTMVTFNYTFRARKTHFLLLLSSDINLRWPTIWSTTNNHCDRSWGDGTMIRSSLNQVSNIFPASVFVFGDCWCSGRWTTCIAADDQNTFAGWSSSIVHYPENEWILVFFRSKIDRII